VTTNSHLVFYLMCVLGSPRRSTLSGHVGSCWLVSDDTSKHELKRFDKCRPSMFRSQSLAPVGLHFGRVQKLQSFRSSRSTCSTIHKPHIPPICSSFRKQKFAAVDWNLPMRTYHSGDHAFNFSRAFLNQSYNM